MGKMKLGLIVATVIFVALFLFAFPLSAYEQPDICTIEDASIFRHMLEPDDMLILLRYEISWGNTSEQPIEPCPDSFYFTWGNSTDIWGNTTALPFHNLGYGKGIVAFYYEADDGNLTDWGEAGNLTVTGTGAVWGGSPPSDQYLVSSDDYSAYSAPSDIREELRQYILSNASFLELDWNTFYIEAGASSRQVDLLQVVDYQNTYLAATGSAYFNGVLTRAMPATVLENYTQILQAICPNVLPFQVLYPQYDDYDWTGNYSETIKQTFDDSPIGDFKEGLSEFLGGIGEDTATTILIVGIVAVLVAYLCYRTPQKFLAALLATYPIFIITSRMGLCNPAVLWLFMCISVIILVYATLFEKGQG